MAIATLTVDLVAKLGNIERDLGKVGQLAEKQARQIDEAFTRTAGVLKSFAGGLVGGLAAGGIVQFAKAAVNALDALNDAADATGSTVENLSALENVARKNGASIDLVETAVVKLNQAFNGLKEGEGAANVIKALGLSVDDLKKKDPALALQDIAVAFQGFKRDGDLARAAQELFGKSLKEVAPFLKDLAEAGTLNATVTTQQAEQAEKFNKQLFALQTNFGNIARSVVADALPAINDYTEAVAKATAATGSLLAGIRERNTGNDRSIDQLKQDIDEVDKKWKALDERRRSFGQRVSNTMTFGATGLGLDSDETELMNQRIVLVKKLQEAQRQAQISAIQGPPADLAHQKSIGDILKEIEEAQKRAAAARHGKEDPFAPGALFNENTILLGKQVEAELTALTKAQDEYVKSIEAIRGPIEAQASQLQDQVRNYGLTTAEIENNTAAQIEEASVLAELNGAYPDQIDLLQRVAKAHREAADAADKLRVKQAIAETKSGKDAERQKDLDFYKEQYLQGKITAEQLQEISDKINGVGEEAKKTDSLFKDLGPTFSSAFEDAIVNGAKFSDVLQGIEKDLIRILARKYLVEPLVNSLEQAGTVNSWGNLFASLTAAFAANGASFDGGIARFAKGDIFASPTMFRFAAGGALRNGIMGEAGPEAIMPLKRGPDGKLGVATSGSGGGTYYIDASGADPSAIARLERTIKELNGSIENRAISAVANQRLRGGSFSKAMGR